MRLLLIACLLAAAAPLSAAPTRFAAGPAQVAIIELYTSEGCSSCPPADAWLGDLRGDPGLWKKFVPLQFHVNYWDSLGWKDRLSTAAFTAREYAYSSAWGSRNVYTPCFVRNGIEWKPQWGIEQGAAAAMGMLSVEVGSDGACRVAFTPGPAAPPAPGGLYEVHVAYLGGGISSDVKAGENRGETLKHEFVVLGLAERIMAKDAGGAIQRATVNLPRPIAAGAARHALAAWVTLKGELQPIQSTGGWL